MIAAYMGHADCVALLLDNGAHINELNNVSEAGRAGRCRRAVLCRGLVGARLPRSLSLSRVHVWCLVISE
jgi:hypothetical protein